MWYILLVSLMTQCLATQVTYHTTSSQAASSASSSNVQKNDWSWQEPLASASNQNENYHPLSFSSADASQQVQGTAQQQYTANIQTQASGVTQVVDQHAQQSADSVIDDILVSNRQGRNLEGYEELYADPKIKNALQIGNDTIARTYIRDKLCTLGLMNCDGLEERRPYYSPHRDIHPQEVIYAQPVTIKPVGRPLPAIAVKRPYGPAKPVPLPPGFGSGPPFSHHFSGPPPQFSGSSFGSPPSFSGPHSFSGPSSGFGGPYPAHKKPSIVHGTRPVYESGIDGEYDFENKFIEKKQVIVQQPTASGVQQHVHHHFHHGEDDNKTPNVAIGSPGLGGSFVNPGIGSHGAIGSNGFNSYGYGSGGTYGNNFNDFEDYKKTFKVKSPSVGNSLDPLQTSSSYANRFPSYVKPKGDSILSNKGFSNGGDGLKVLNSGFGGNNFGNTEHGNSGFISESNSFNSGSNNFGTNGGFGNNAGLGSSNGYGSNTGLGGSNSFGSNTGLGGSNSFGSNTGLGGSNGFVDNGFASTNSYDDCICVPYDQCAGLGQAGRKDDLFLAIDPRNLGKNIEAETVDVVLTDSNGTMSVVRVPKGVNETEQAQHSKEQDKTSDQGKTVEKSSDAFVAKENDSKRTKRDVKHVVEDKDKNSNAQGRQFGRPPVCGPKHVCCRRNQIYPGSGNHGRPRPGQCGVRNSQGINGRIKTPVYVDGDSEFGEYPWQVAILKKDPSESVYVCGGTLISPRHIMTAAHCVKTHGGRDLRARLGEWDVNHDVEFYPYIERDIVSVHVNPEFYAGTLYNDVAILKLDHDVDFEKNPHISPACLPDKHDDFNGARCWTTGWGKDAFGDFGKYQNILKEVDVPVVSNQVCEHQMRRTRLGPSFNLHPGFICAGGEEGKDACKGDGGGPMVCERHGKWQLAGIVSWGIGCGQPGIPGVYSRVSYYLDWVRQIVDQY